MSKTTPIALLIDSSKNIADELIQTEFPTKTAKAFSTKLINLIPNFWAHNTQKQCNFLKSVFWRELCINRYLIEQNFDDIFSFLKLEKQKNDKILDTHFIRCSHCNKHIRDPVTLSDRRIVDRDCAMNDFKHFKHLTFSTNLEYNNQLAKIDHTFTIVIIAKNKTSNSCLHTVKGTQKVGFQIQFITTYNELKNYKVYSQDGVLHDTKSTTVISKITALFFVDFSYDSEIVKIKHKNETNSIVVEPWMMLYHILFNVPNFDEYSRIEIVMKHSEHSKSKIKPMLELNVSSKWKLTDIEMRVVPHGNFSLERYNIFRYLPRFCDNQYEPTLFTFDTVAQKISGGELNFSFCYRRKYRCTYDAIREAMISKFEHAIVFVCGDALFSFYDINDLCQIHHNFKFLRVVNLSPKSLSKDFSNFVVQTKGGKIINFKSLDDVSSLIDSQ